MKKYLPVILIFVFAISNIFSYQYGAKKTYEKMARRITFYATIMEIEEDSFFVKGIDTNEERFRGYFKCFPSEDTYYNWRSIPRQKSDLKEGDIISITFFGDLIIQLEDESREQYGIIRDIYEIIKLK